MVRSLPRLRSFCCAVAIACGKFESFMMVNLVIGSSRSRCDRYRIGDRKGAIAGFYSVALSAR